jgi:hypothetical protein
VNKQQDDWAQYQWFGWDDALEAEDAIREFKLLNPDHEVHIKAS